MGTDIHCHVEIKVNDRWLHYNHQMVERNYSLFAKMAGVRNPLVKPISLPKGIPADATETTKLDFDYECGHSSSWLSWEEIRQLNDWYELQEWKDKIHGFESVFGYLFSNALVGSGPKFLQDVRLVFWFDN